MVRKKKDNDKEMQHSRSPSLKKKNTRGKPLSKSTSKKPVPRKKTPKKKDQETMEEGVDYSTPDRTADV